MSGNVNIRRMRREDVDAVTEIEKATFAVPWSRESFRRELEQNVAARYLVAETDGRNGKAGKRKTDPGASAGWNTGSWNLNLTKR